MKRTGKKFLIFLLLAVASVCVLLTACGADAFQISFDTGDGPAMESVEVPAGEEYVLPAPPARTGYSFEGWYASADFSGSPVTSCSPDGDATFYAKWEQLAKIVLDPNGGSLGETTLYARAGTNLLTLLKDHIPAKQGCEFGAWFNGESEITESSTLPADGITLTARYKVGYTVEIYLQNLTLDGYDRAEDFVGYEYAGTNFTPAPPVEGFYLAEHEGSVTTKVLDEDPAKNVYRFYFDRLEYEIVFHANFPSGEDEIETVSYLNGTEADVPADLFTHEGYCLVGWAESAHGEPVYRVDSISPLLFFGAGETEAPHFTVNGDKTLYAVWNMGYSDLFGGEDHLFLLSDDAKEIFLFRAGFYFKGEYTARRSTFDFTDASDEVIFEGKVFDDHTFIYYDPDRASTSCTLYEVGKGLVENYTIYLGLYNEITYACPDAEDSEGTYYVDEDGFYIATFTTGEYAGKTLTILRGQVTVDGRTRNAFQIRNDEELGYGTLYRFAVSGTDIMIFREEYYSITLNGFGVATYRVGDTLNRYTYTSDGDLYTLVNSEGRIFGVIRLLTINNRHGYMIYQEDQDKDYTNNGETLSLDGVYLGKYLAADGTTVEGLYSSFESVLGGTIVTFVSDDGKIYTFLTDTTTETVIGDDGEVTEVVSDTFTKKPNGYAEYYYADEEGVYYAPVIVFDEEKEGEASLYGRTSSGVYEKAAVGSYTLQENTGFYLFTVTEHFGTNASTTLVDYATVKSVVFSTGVFTGSQASYRVFYWHSMTTEDGQTTGYEKQYHSQDNRQTLTLVGGFATYFDGSDTFQGQYVTSSDGVTTVTVSSDTRYYFELHEDGTFLLLSQLLGRSNARLADGSTTTREYLEFDGKGGVTYNVVTAGEDGNVTTTHSGTYRESDRMTEFGSQIYTFTSSDLTFDFMLVGNGSAVYFSRYHAQANGEFSGDSGTILLDGFSFRLRYSAGGTIYEGNYTLAEDGAVLFLTEDGETFRFDLDLARKTFTVRGGEYGAYLLVDNLSVDGVILQFDGYGALTVSVPSEEGESAEYHGSYELLPGGGYRLSWNEGNVPKVLEGILDFITLSDTTYHAFYVTYKEIVLSYVNLADLSVLTLDSHGGAVKYTATGRIIRGEYVIISETLLYYADRDGFDACIYEYDKEALTATPIKFSPVGYYTTDLESLLFSEYGFMIFNGTTRYYYNIDEQKNGHIFLHDPSSPDANEYGYVERLFGEFSDTKNFDGKTYYKSNGYSLTFRRGDAGKDKYPVQVAVDQSYPLGDLVFRPSGSLEFSVSGEVSVNGTLYACTVTRTILPDGGTEMYLTIPAGEGNYRFDITVSYVGDQSGLGGANTYEVTRMRRIIAATSYSYFYYYYLFYMYLGASFANSIENTIGTVTVTYEFDEEGQEIRSFFVGDFKEGCGMFDTQGNLVPGGEHEFERIGNVYTVEYAMQDGYTYRLYFQFSNFLGVRVFQVYAFTRVETLKDGEYQAVVERVIVSEGVMQTGSVFLADLTKNGEAIEADLTLIRDGGLCFVLREMEEGKIVDTTYYLVTFALNSSEDVEDEEQAVPTYRSMKVEERDVTTYYSADGTCYVDVTDQNEIILFFKDGTLYQAASSVRNADGTYTVVTISQRTFTVTISGENATIVEVTDAAE